MNLDSSNSGHFHKVLGQLNTRQYPRRNSHRPGNQHHRHTKTGTTFHRLSLTYP